MVEKTGSSQITRTDSRVLPPSQGWAPHLMVHEEVPTRHLSPVWRRVDPPAHRLPALGGGLHPLQAAWHMLISFCKCKRTFSVMAALGPHRLKGSSKVPLSM